MPPTTRQESLLATLPGENNAERVAVVLCNSAREGSRLELRQQSWGEGVGWFTQSTVQLDPAQVAELKMTLTASSAHSSAPIRPRRTPGFVPKLVHAESA